MLNSIHQHTLFAAVTISGIGVHSGAPATVKMRAAPADTGILFIRTDITDKDNVIPARHDYVVDTRLCTVIANKHGVSVATIEHLMAAIAAVGLDNAIVEIDGPEMPIMDGSAIEFIRAINHIGLIPQPERRRALVIKKPLHIQDGDKEVYLTPADGQFFGFEIAFPSAAIGRQKYTIALSEDSFRAEIAPCRTFGFLHEVEQLRKMGLARGGSLENAIVVNGDEVLNPEGLRFQTEFVRHKILDAVGDLYLAGGQLIGHYHGVKAGHAMNNKVLHALFADPSAYEWVELGQEAAASLPVGKTVAEPLALAG